MSSTPLITVQQHIFEEQRRLFPTASGEFSWLLSGIGSTAISGCTVTVNGAATLGSVLANGSALLTAGTTITGNSLITTKGSAALIAGSTIDWTTLNVATTLGVTSTGGGISLVTASSGGTQTLHAGQSVTFDRLATTGFKSALDELGKGAPVHGAASH